MINIKKGLDLPISGTPRQSIEQGNAARSVAVLGPDYPGMKPTMEVKLGDTVAKGQILFSDKKTPGVNYTAPAAGTVIDINRGAKRALRGVVIEIEAAGEAVQFSSHAAEQIQTLDKQSVIQQLLQSGSWPALRTRPFSRVPDPETVPHSIFVTAIDTNPLAADPQVVIAPRKDDFVAGLAVLTTLTEGTVHVCQSVSADLGNYVQSEKIQSHTFGGIHPAGLPGTHIHFIDPVSATKTVWYIGYQDVLAFGHLFLTGQLDVERVVAIGGPGATNPRLVKTILGANLTELTAGELADGEHRIISGSVLSGRGVDEGLAYLGRYHVQVSVLREDRERKLFGWVMPGAKMHSVFPAFLSKWVGEKSVDFTTNTNGSARGMVPIGTYDAVMPLDILATQLMRSLLVGDLEKAIELGCLELDEDDIALCTYACPGKYEFGPVLREVLTQIEKEG
ncbi:MAG: NADH:ubiquinone reductase (Na(+)-transporting) subunit A [Gammaproteobacteria bacterium]|nr:NADH:ubiquinone reductase (Na(+)-transporting) subunit A [Gammaproteobacteria bacterium]|tara:strand:- start:26047 stop:27396 length:1350 start_codon:yes stop_codon:yes gene_type:complete